MLCCYKILLHAAKIKPQSKAKAQKSRAQPPMKPHPSPMTKCVKSHILTQQTEEYELSAHTAQSYPFPYPCWCTMPKTSVLYPAGR